MSKRRIVSQNIHVEVPTVKCLKGRTTNTAAAFKAFEIKVPATISDHPNYGIACEILSIDLYAYTGTNIPPALSLADSGQLFTENWVFCTKKDIPTYVPSLSEPYNFITHYEKKGWYRRGLDQATDVDIITMSPVMEQYMHHYNCTHGGQGKYICDDKIWFVVDNISNNATEVYEWAIYYRDKVMDKNDWLLIHSNQTK